MCEREGVTREYEREKIFFKIGDYVRVKKETSIYTKGREEVYSKEVYRIVGVEGNIYTLSAAFEGRTTYSYNSLLKIKLSKENLEKHFKETKREKKQKIIIERREPSQRIAIKNRKETLRNK